MAGRVWNSLPQHVTSATSLSVFRSRRKSGEWWHASIDAAIPLIAPIIVTVVPEKWYCHCRTHKCLTDIPFTFVHYPSRTRPFTYCCGMIKIADWQAMFALLCFYDCVGLPAINGFCEVQTVHWNWHFTDESLTYLLTYCDIPGGP